LVALAVTVVALTAACTTGAVDAVSTWSALATGPSGYVEQRGYSAQVYVRCGEVAYRGEEFAVAHIEIKGYYYLDANGRVPALEPEVTVERLPDSLRLYACRSEDADCAFPPGGIPFGPVSEGQTIVAERYLSRTVRFIVTSDDCEFTRAQLRFRVDGYSIQQNAYLGPAYVPLHSVFLDVNIFNEAADEPAPAPPPPDDDRIVFSSDLDEEDIGDIYAVEADGTALSNLTNTPGVHEFEPRWSRDRSRIAYLRSDGFETADLWVMNADGSDQERITFFGAPEGDGSSSVLGLSWGPDGDRIALSVWQEDAEIHVVDLQSRDLEQVTAGGFDTDPAWSPDGDTIVFARDDELWVVSLQDMMPAPLFSAGEDASGLQPNWNSDGTRIVFVRAGGIWTVAADGTGADLVTQDSGGWSHPAFSPEDGRIVLEGNGGLSTADSLTGAGRTVIPLPAGFHQDPDW
jgi:Tol biopolymer transport system component